jgi:integrase
MEPNRRQFGVLQDRVEDPRDVPRVQSCPYLAALATAISSERQPRVDPGRPGLRAIRPLARPVGPQGDLRQDERAPGVQLVEVSMLLGHAELRTTADLYTHLQQQTAARAAAHMDAVLKR